MNISGTYINVGHQYPPKEEILPSRYSEGNKPSGEITTGPLGKVFPSCKHSNHVHILLLVCCNLQPAEKTHIIEINYD